MKTILLVLASLSLAACAAWSPEQKQTTLDWLQAMRESGAISEAQFQAMYEIFKGISTGFNWEQLLAWILGVGGTIFGAERYVRLRRGVPKPLAPDDAAVFTKLIAEAKNTKS